MSINLVWLPLRMLGTSCLRSAHPFGKSDGKFTIHLTSWCIKLMVRFWYFGSRVISMSCVPGILEMQLKNVFRSSSPSVLEYHWNFLVHFEASTVWAVGSGRALTVRRGDLSEGGYLGAVACWLIADLVSVSPPVWRLSGDSALVWRFSGDRALAWWRFEGETSLGWRRLSGERPLPFCLSLSWSMSIGVTSSSFSVVNEKEVQAKSFRSFILFFKLSIRPPLRRLGSSRTSSAPSPIKRCIFSSFLKGLSPSSITTFPAW